MILSAVFHDIGRFEQAELNQQEREKGNLISFGPDSDIYDHGDKGYIYLLSEKETIKKLFNLSELDFLALAKSVKYHNKKEIPLNPGEISPFEKIICGAIRDADKIANLKLKIREDCERFLCYKKDCLLSFTISKK